jgi:hypothetical protein
LHAVTIDTVLVDKPGNAAAAEPGYGAVAYGCAISKTVDT